MTRDHVVAVRIVVGSRLEIFARDDVSLGTVTLSDQRLLKLTRVES